MKRSSPPVAEGDLTAAAPDARTARSGAGTSGRSRRSLLGGGLLGGVAGLFVLDAQPATAADRVIDGGEP